MSDDRVEELEARVAELEASVEGLTDELVESKVRIRELEDAVDGDLGFGTAEDGETTDAETADGDDDIVEAGEAVDRAKPEPTEGDEDEDADDIIVA